MSTKALAHMLLASVDRANINDALQLCVTPEQERHVGTVAEALAYAYVCDTYQPQIVVHGGSAVGFVATEKLGDTVRLLRLLIDHRYQRCGLGTAAFRLLVEQARAAGATLLDLYVHRDATASIAFYAKVGCTIATDGDTSHYHATYAIQ
jgi:ribosomal protein S18 acetylase RimI-like enzyme